MQKDYKKLIKRAVDQGWRVEYRKSGKAMLFPPDGSSPVVIHGTNSDRRALANTVKKMTARGYREPGN